MRHLKKLSLMLAFSLAVLAGPAHAVEPFDEGWLELLRQEAIQKGVSEKTAREVLRNLTPMDKFPAKGEQKEFSRKITLDDYLRPRLTAVNIGTGADYMREYMPSLLALETQYKVPPQYIMAIWAIETHFGQNMGKEDVIPSLVTLARDHPDRDKRRQFRGETIAALKLIDEGYAELRGKGSWAGAVGNPQFLPSSIIRDGVDLDGDGKKDIWNNRQEVFASVANFLMKSRLGGWREGERWGREVVLPKGFNRALLTETLKHQTQKTPDEWNKLGVRLPGGGQLPAEDTMAGMMIAPDGPGGRTFLVYNNFKSVMGYNPSYKYALTVGMLADEIAAAVSKPQPPSPGLN